jgi:hypothetical protein
MLMTRTASVQLSSTGAAQESGTGHCRTVALLWAVQMLFSGTRGSRLCIQWSAQCTVKDRNVSTVRIFEVHCYFGTSDLTDVVPVSGVCPSVIWWGYDGRHFCLCLFSRVIAFDQSLWDLI